MKLPRHCSKPNRHRPEGDVKKEVSHLLVALEGAADGGIVNYFLA